MLQSHVTTLHSVALVLELIDAETADQLLSGSGITPEDLQHPDMRITRAQELRVFANALQHCHALGLVLGRRMHVSSYGPLGYAMLSSTTLGDALRLALDYPALLGTYFHLELLNEGDTVWLSAGDYRYTAELETFSVEFCLASLKQVCDDLLGRPLALTEATFRHPVPAYEEAYLGSFACERRFLARRNAFGFSVADMQTPLPLADRVTTRDMRELCQRLNNEFISRQGIVERCREMLTGQLCEPPGLHGLARQLNCSSRTLRRHLQEAGTGYQRLLDELRYERARALLEEGSLSINAIAEAMGFSETASFRHAFQRWSGLAPSRFRAERGSLPHTLRTPVI